MPQNYHLKISIIIPVLNEAPTIASVISTAQNGKNVEIIVADGGSSDGTAEIATSLGVRVVSTAPGRAAQMNAGAIAATGDILLFLHADTLLPPAYDSGARLALAKPQTVAGAFELKIDAPGHSLRLVEIGVNCRSHFLQMPYGDQAIFLYSATFDKIGGFPDLPLMEDFEFVRRLQKQGRIAIVPQSVLTSARRWQQLGVLKTTAINQIVIIAYFLGVSPDRLAFWYRRQKKNSSQN
ncbi:MAG: TIGR04283 family arsenosugar biosynthesis glycosyltransferase [Microcoleus sp. PH2017_10_PVI_O_A]|uniref:TIGR04283 family arsenosugar biosynthesis glycosyltransferase n=1 Tax=unclassified Microcoleus TaxID=2642155 RepID=UPI001D6E44BE|nr:MULTISPECIES: TIGR04283 family arsenosugar biosynthesis glycosyltransferase [unclassified Microcoleus]TAE85619.1 MAG: glycosyltransferase [Oscillatoriales cyanobacterium]MCC3405051.1 TIGR04283 family arsenosugar biosynthesis glycosyltransferase [Microcoleus sp. PH2017_10_PVI_O_A]MCC3459132.1 TIGR04283 family arsenosugar biosynthesis glycosyltransferase [Microcoleus sp. PH2017_11_PCY_U_A]MCC3477189.1 TIGR04283 family arsenosugar biosynthesis glycosyltransferase [Microcoleus sp. PH2017_12_PCY_